MKNLRLFIFLIIIIIIIIIMITGLSCAPIRLSEAPRARLGCYATSTPGTRWLGMKGLGRHNYDSFIGEGNGIVYTCRGGHIDITHLRIGADNTCNVINKIQKSLINNEKGFSFSLQVDKSTNYITWGYPDNWSALKSEEKQKIAKEMSYQLAPYLVFTATSWHEMLTWYGFKCMAIVPEDASGFSWEDSYSNLLGCYLAVDAVKDAEHSYSEAMTILLEKKMQELGIQSAHNARKAAESMRGKWFTGNLWVVMKKRNFDVGLDDGFVSPSLVPGLSECPDAKPALLPAPNPDVSRLGFSYKHEIEPHEWEKGKLLRIVYPDGKGKRVEPLKHFPILLAHLEQEALAKGWEIR
jgi:hypothetical protein